MASLSVSAFSPVRNVSTSTDDTEVRTAIHFPNSELNYATQGYVPWWNGQSYVVKPSMWTWWAQQNRRIPSLYRFHQFAGTTDDEKPTQSYIGLIAEAILSCPAEKLILSDIYGFILANYPYFRNKGTGWRNSIRHNLSLNDCFIKAGRSQNGKGHFWAISPLYIDDFRRGDFRRKRTYRRPSRSKKARAKLEALKQKEKQEEKGTSKEICEGNATLVDDSQQSAAADMRIILKTEQADPRNDKPESGTMYQEKKNNNESETAHKDADYIDVEHLHKQPGEVDAISTNDTVVCSSADQKPEENNKINVEDENSNEPLSITTDNHDNKDDTINGRTIAELRASSRRSFDMAALLAPERTSHNVGILREMYPMYYNIMNLGIRNTAECYGAASGYCSHCVSMLGTISPHYVRPVYTMANYSTGQLRNERNRRDSME